MKIFPLLLLTATLGAAEPSLDPGQGPAIARQVVGVLERPGKMLLGNGDLGVVIERGERDASSWRLGLGKADYWGVMQGSITTVGNLTLTCRQMVGSSTRMEQRLGTAEVTGSFTAPTGAALTTTAWVDRPDNLVVLELRNTGTVPQEWTGTLNTSRGKASAPWWGAMAAGTWMESGADLSSWKIGNRSAAKKQAPFVGRMAEVTLHDRCVAPGDLAHGKIPPVLTWTPASLPPSKARLVTDDQRGPVKEFTTPEELLVGNGQLPPAWTVTGIVKPTAVMADGTIFVASNFENPNQYPFFRGLLLQVRDGHLSAALNLERATAPEPLPLDRWTTVTVSYGDGILRLYQDATQVASATLPPASAVLGWDKLAFRPGDPALPFQGMAPLVRVHQQVLGVPVTIQGQTVGITIPPGGTATWLVSAVTDRNTPDFRAVAERLVQVDAAALASRKASHARAWDDFWSRSFVDVPDTKIRDAWYGALYLLACCSRADVPPPGLWYNFITTINERWQGDYTLNYNFQAPFWAALPTNHPELMDSYDTFLMGQIPRGKALAENAWRVDPKQQPTSPAPLLAARTAQPTPQSVRYRGILFYTHLMPGLGWSNDYATMWGQKSSALFCAVNMVHRWRYTRDPAYARTVYPFLREVAEFWDSFYTVEGDALRIVGDAVTEGGHDIDPVTSLSFLRLFYPALIEMSEVVGADADQRTRWAAIPGRLKPLPIVPADQLPSLAKLGEAYTAGRLAIRTSVEGTSDFCRPMVAEWKQVAKERTNSSGMNAVQTIFPAWAFGLDSPADQLKAARDTVFFAAQWWDRNNTCTFYPSAAAIGHDPEEILTNLRIFLDGTQKPNFTIETSGGGTETVAVVPATLALMFVQSHQGRIHVFPNWPRTKDARFGQHNASGGFLVSGSMTGGVIGPVQIRSTAGMPCRLANPWPGHPIRVTVAGGRSSILPAQDTFVIPTAPNDVLTMTP